jgi:peptidoglycan/xylan/chitin deacetylase (PgdA/CDA1 family)
MEGLPPTRERHPIERLLAAVDAPPILEAGTGDTQNPAIQCAVASGPMRRLTQSEWQLFARLDGQPRVGGRPFARFVLDDGRAVTASLDPDTGRVHVPFSLAEVFDNYVLEHWIEGLHQRRVSPRQLDAFYRVKRLIPRRAQLAGRRALIRWQGSPDFPRWPYDDSVPRLLRFYVHCAALASGRSQMRFSWFWPGRANAALILTHDVESAAGLRGAVRVADAEEQRGLRSSFNIVARGYPIDWGIVRELKERGFEIGVHGVFHDRSMFFSRDNFEAQQPALREAVAGFGASGFRSPATHRVLDWLPELPVTYDCSVPHSDPYEPQPGGCCSPWPYMIGDLVELPYTLPQDHTLFTLLGHRTPELWLRQVDRLERAHGLIHCLSHPDPGYLGDERRFGIYQAFLDAMAEREGLWKALPREVAAWWRARDAGDSPTGADCWARCDLQSGEVTLGPPPAA